MPYLRKYTGLQLQWVLLTSLIAFSWSWRCDLLLSSQSRSLLLLACQIPLPVIAIQETEIVQTRWMCSYCYYGYILSGADSQDIPSPPRAAALERLVCALFVLVQLWLSSSPE